MTDIRSDAELVTAHLGGDTSALAAIYDRDADALHDTVAATLNDRHDAEDLTHDVFVVASRRLDQLRDADRLKPWSFAIRATRCTGGRSGAGGNGRPTLNRRGRGSDDGPRPIPTWTVPAPSTRSWQHSRALLWPVSLNATNSCSSCRSATG